MKAVFIAFLFVGAVFARSVLKDADRACPIEDPIIAPPGPVNISLPPLFELFEGLTTSEVRIAGLSFLNATVDINAILLTATAHITLPSIDVEGDYEAAVGYIDARPMREETLPSGNFTGYGTFKLSATDLVVDLRATLFINLIGNRVGILALTLNTVSFGTFTADFGAGYRVNGKEIDWAEWSKTFKGNFDTDFADAQIKTQITEKVRLSANVVVGKYTLPELIDLIGGGGGGGDNCTTTAAPPAQLRLN